MKFPSDFSQPLWNSPDFSRSSRFSRWVAILNVRKFRWSGGEQHKANVEKWNISYVRKSQIRTVLPAALYMISPVELRAMSEIAVSPGGHVIWRGTLLLPVAPPSTVKPADLPPHTSYNLYISKNWTITIDLFMTYTVSGGMFNPTKPTHSRSVRHYWIKVFKGICYK